MDRPEPSLTSDGRIVREALRKIECRECRLVRNGIALDERQLAAHYSAYELGLAAAVSEPLFFTAGGVKPRSEVVFEWLKESIDTVGGPAPATLLEIGCGEGNVLARFQRAWPSSVVEGLDLSDASAAAAVAQGLNVRHGSYRDARGQYDLIYSFAVIEHVPSPADFLATLGAHLTDRGLLLVSQPCQDGGCNDVFLSDHLFHFSSAHLSEFGRRAGLVERLRVVGQPLIPDFSLHVFSRHGSPTPAPALEVAADVRRVVERWQAIFDRVDHWLAAANGPLAIWGLGQTFQMLLAYSRLKESSITIGIDDNAARFAGRVPFPVAPLESAGFDASAARVLLTFAPAPAVVQRLRARGLDWFSPFVELPT